MSLWPRNQCDNWAHRSRSYSGWCIYSLCYGLLNDVHISPQPYDPINTETALVNYRGVDALAATRVEMTGCITHLSYRATMIVHYFVISAHIMLEFFQCANFVISSMLLHVYSFNLPGFGEFSNACCKSDMYVKPMSLWQTHFAAYHANIKFLKVLPLQLVN